MHSHVPKTIVEEQYLTIKSNIDVNIVIKLLLIALCLQHSFPNIKYLSYEIL